MPELLPAAIALGSNLGSDAGDRRAHIERALGAIGRLGTTSLVRTSTVIETDPVGLADQPAFLNACCLIETALPPRALLESLQAIERDLGRDRSSERRWGPRTIDLDLLLYADRVIDEPGLTVPHPRMHERAFVLLPLAEIAPEMVHPLLGRSIAELLGDLDPEPASVIRADGIDPPASVLGSDADTHA